MKRTLGIAAALLLAAGAMAPGCGVRKGVAGLVLSSSIGTYPKESVALVVLEIRKIRALRPDTVWIANLAALADRDGGPIAEVTRRLGPDVLAALDRLSLAVVPQPGGPIAYGILAEGTFDREKVRQALGEDLVTLVETGQMDVSVTLLADGSLALGPRKVLETMRANQTSRGNGLAANPAILEPLERVRPEAQVWGAFDCRSLQRMYREAATPGDLGGLRIDSAPVQSLSTIALRGMIGDPVVLDLFGQADGEKNARTLADAARGLVALGRVGAGRDQAKEWVDFLDSIRIRQSGASVDLSASIPEKAMESFVAQVMSSRRPASEARLPGSPAGQSPAPSPAAAASQGPAQPQPAAPQPRTSPHKPAASRHAPAAPPAGSEPSTGSSTPPAPDSRGTPAPSDGAP